MRRIFFIVILTSLSLVSFGQGKRLFLKVAPLSLLDPSYPTILLGAEVKPLAHWSGTMEYGIKTPSILIHWNDDLHNLKISKVRTELRYYLKNYKGFYFGLEYLHTQKVYTKNNSWYSNANGTYHFTSSQVKIGANGYAFKSGYNISLSKRLFLDLFIGLGERWVDVKHHAPDAVFSTDEPFTEWGSSTDLREGTERKIYGTLGFKLAYSIGKQY